MRCTQRRVASLQPFGIQEGKDSGNHGASKACATNRRDFALQSSRELSCLMKLLKSASHNNHLKHAHIVEAWQEKGKHALELGDE